MTTLSCVQKFLPEWWEESLLDACRLARAHVTSHLGVLNDALSGTLTRGSGLMRRDGTDFPQRKFSTSRQRRRAQILNLRGNRQALMFGLIYKPDTSLPACRHAVLKPQKPNRKNVWRVGLSNSTLLMMAPSSLSPLNLRILDSMTGCEYRLQLVYNIIGQEFVGLGRWRPLSPFEALSLSTSEWTCQHYEP